MKGGPQEMAKRRLDRGYTLIELLLVIVVLAIMATVVVAAAGGFTAEAEDSACQADAHVLIIATESYFAQRSQTVITPVGTTDDRYELRLVDLGFMRRVSSYYDLDATGRLLPATGSRCPAIAGP
jgi:prepilin-type N-terminal cleavage/methylation domain-containing protein